MSSAHRRAFPKGFAVLLLTTLLFSSLPGIPIQAAGLPTFTKIELYANIETVGVVVTGTDLPATAQLLYRQNTETAWHTGHPLLRIGNDRLVGSLFGLSPSTTYIIKVLEGATEISGSTVTQPDQLQFTPSLILHVDDDAPPGGDGSGAKPFKTIQEAVNHAGPGTQVLVADGVYRESISFPASGAPGQWIQVRAQGRGAILDGSETLYGDVWKRYSTKEYVWFTGVETPIKYLARDGGRFYEFDSLKWLTDGRGYGKVPTNEGWYFEPNNSKLFVRNLDDPSKHTWQVPRLSHAFDVAGRDWIWIEGFEMRFYGAESGGCGVCATDASHLVVRRNKIHNMQLGVYVKWTGGEDRGNDTRIEYNEIYDPPLDEWPWKAVKGSPMEGTGIVIRGHIGTIVRGNLLHNLFNGIYTGSSADLENPAIAFDADVYNNYIHHIGDDALEPEGAGVNQRFRNNKVDKMLVGVSLAPVTQGPVWILRSSFTNFSGSSLKWDLKSDGAVLVYHNTSWTNAADLNAMSMISPVHNAVMRNNIFQGNGYAFEEPFTGSTGQDWNYDNWYTARGPDVPHFVWEKISYKTIADLCAATGLECNGYDGSPGLTDPARGDFRLLPSSPDIDRGVAIPGINDLFSGRAPDLGAYEFTPPREPTGDCTGSRH
jgi:hypothetical protein